MADDDETPHPRWIRSFCIASKETTVEQFQRFLSEHPPVARGAGAATDGPPDHPQGSVTWYEAAAYCNWLSSQEGLPPDQCCYAPNAGGAYASGMRVAPGYLQRRGYRLPTEAEWEYACRAGAVTGWHFGDDATYLEKYGVSAATRNEPLPIGRRKPNDFGLFDLLGNVAEWCQDAYAAYPVSVADASQTTTDQSDEVDDGRARVIRGGAFRDPADRVRCAARAKQPPTHRTDSVGFRVGRSYP
jgi:formylglycine-generating enzyme required for sulfatase activity